MVSVYVSYAWKDEEQNPLVDKLGAVCRARGIDLVRDIAHVGYGRSIREFMDRLAAAGHVVLVLSDTYFRSDYCMYELRGIYEHQDFRKRVHPIVLSGTRLHKPKDRIPWIAHWIKEKKELEEALETLEDPKHTLELRKSLEDYADFHRLMDQLTCILADMNTLTEDVHRDTDFAALLDRIAPVKDDFRRRIIDEVRHILACNAPLSKALQGRLHDSVAAPVSDLAEALCSARPEQAISTLLFPATLACLKSLDAQASEFANAWTSAKSVLAWLTLFAVDAQAVGIEQRQALAAGKLVFEIPVSTPLGVEIVSSRHREMAPQLRVAKSNVLGAGAIEQPRYESGWSENAPLENLLLEIWICVFPEESRTQLSLADRRKLKATLRVRREQETFHHYIAVPADQAKPLALPAFYQRLQEVLPDLSLIFFHGDGEASALLVSDEYYFMALIHQFLTLPDLLAKRR